MKRRYAFCCWLLGSAACFASSWCLTPADVNRVDVTTKRFSLCLLAARTAITEATADVLQAAYVPGSPDLDPRILDQPL